MHLSFTFSHIPSFLSSPLSLLLFLSSEDFPSDLLLLCSDEWWLDSVDSYDVNLEALIIGYNCSSTIYYSIPTERLVFYVVYWWELTVLVWLTPPVFAFLSGAYYVTWPFYVFP